MSTELVKRIDFLNRLFALSACYSELIDFLKSEKTLSTFELDKLSAEADKSKFLVNHLQRLKKDDKLLLLDYEWTILPVERLKLTLITERMSKEFTYNPS